MWIMLLFLYVTVNVQGLYDTIDVSMELATTPTAVVPERHFVLQADGDTARPQVCRFMVKKLFILF